MSNRYSTTTRGTVGRIRSHLHRGFSRLGPNTTIPSGVNSIVNTLVDRGNTFGFYSAAAADNESCQHKVRSLFRKVVTTCHGPTTRTGLRCRGHRTVRRVVLTDRLVCILSGPRLWKRSVSFEGLPSGSRKLLLGLIYSRGPARMLQGRCGKLSARRRRRLSNVVERLGRLNCVSIG